MVRETRHLWVGNLPDNIREDRIREHFKRYGRVQNVKLLGRTEAASSNSVTTSSSASVGVCATVAFMDIKSASKAHNAEHVLDERILTTEYYEPAAIPSAAAGAPSAGSSPAGSGYSGSSSSVNSTPVPGSTRYHASSEEGTGAASVAVAAAAAAAAVAATAAAPANWRGTNDSATEYCRRGNTPGSYSRYQRNNSAPYSTPPSNVDRRWYAGGGGGGSSTPSTPGGATEAAARRRRRSGSSRSSRSSSSSANSDDSRTSSPAPAAPPHPAAAAAAHQPPHHNHHHNHRNSHSHQWSSSTSSGRPLAICVRNLPTRSTDSSLKDGLYHEYKKHGKVVWVKIVGQNADRYAIVRFKKPSDVEKALEVSQDKQFFGCKISVAPHQSCDEEAESVKPYETDIDEYHPKANRTLFIGNLEKDVTQQQLRDKFKQFGRIIEIDIKKGSGGGAGYAFCQYATIASVVEAIRTVDGEYVGSSRVKLGFGKPVATTCVWVDGLTEHTEKQVLGAVSRCGSATSVCVDRAAGAALVHFEQAAAAGVAMRELRRVAAQAAAAEPDHPKLAVDYATRECQEAFYEQLEKHGGSAALASSERLGAELAARYLNPNRHEQIRYEVVGSRSRGSSYSRCGARSSRFPDHYDADYPDRRGYDEMGPSPQPEAGAYEERAGSVMSPPRRRHRRDSSPDDHKHHSKEWHRSVVGTAGGVVCTVRGRSVARRRHRRRRSGTPLRDEPPAEPRRPPPRTDRSEPMRLPLPKFAAQLRAGAAPPAPPAAPPPPASPQRPPSLSSSEGEAPHSPTASLEERIRSLDERYERWSRLDPPAHSAPRPTHHLLQLDLSDVKPSDVARSLLAKRSVFDEDSERLQRPPSPPPPPPPPPPPDETLDARPRPDEPKRTEDPKRFDESRRLEDAKRPEEPKRFEEQKRSEEPKRLDDIRHQEEVKRPEESKRFEDLKRSDDANRPDDVRRPDDSKRSDDCKKSDEAKRAEEARRLEDAKRAEESRKLEEIKRAEESRRVDEFKRFQEAKRYEEQKRLELKRHEELKRLEEKRLEEQKRLEEKRQEELKQLEEKRQEELKRLEEKRQEELKRAEAKRQEELRLLEEKRLEEQKRLDDKRHESSKRIQEKMVEDSKRSEKYDSKAIVKQESIDVEKSSPIESETMKSENELEYLPPPLDSIPWPIDIPLPASTPPAPVLAPDASPPPPAQPTHLHALSQLELEIKDEINKMSQMTQSPTTSEDSNKLFDTEPTKKTSRTSPPSRVSTPSRTSPPKHDGPVHNHVKDAHEKEVHHHKHSTSKRPSLDSSDSRELSKHSEKCDKELINKHSQLDHRQSLKENSQPGKSEGDKSNSSSSHERKHERSDREKSRHKDKTSEKDKHDRSSSKYDKDKHPERFEKDKRPSVDETKKTNLEKAEKSRTEKEKDMNNKIEKESERSHRDKNEREERSKHHDDKSSRHDHYKRDKRKESSDLAESKRKETNDLLEKHKKDDKHKHHDKHKKEHIDSKKENERKKETELKRKSSRDETSRDLCRKDSTDSSTSRASYESNKAKEIEAHESKDEQKGKMKSVLDGLTKIKTEKESYTKSSESFKYEDSVHVKTEIKEEKSNHVDHIKSTQSLDPPTLQPQKIKSENIDKARHYSLDSPSVDHKRKERLNSCSSLPSHIGHKRRMSSQDSFSSIGDEIKKIKSEPKSERAEKLSERRDSKDGRSSEKLKTPKFNKGHFAKLLESKTKEDKKNQVKPPDDIVTDFKSESKEAKSDKHHKYQIKKSPKHDPEDNAAGTTLPDIKTESLHHDIDFLATLELRSSEEDEKQKALRKEMKEKKRLQQLQQIQELQMQQGAMQAEGNKIKDDKKNKSDEKRKEAAREKRMSTDRKSKDEKDNRRKNRKQATSDSSDSDEPKKHSIFDIVDDGPTYISMYDKVKARSCKNMQKQEEEKRQEKIKAKFSQLKQSRAKREEKKRSSWDEDSDSEHDRKDSQKLSATSSSEDDRRSNNDRKRDRVPTMSFDSDRSLTNDFFSMTHGDEESRNKSSRKNSRSRIMSDTSDDDSSKRRANKSRNIVEQLRKEMFANSESPLDSQRRHYYSKMDKDYDMPAKEGGADRIKKNSLLNLFGKSDSDESKLNKSRDTDNEYKSNLYKPNNEFSSESESMLSNVYNDESRNKKHKKKQKKNKLNLSDDDIKLSITESLDSISESKHKHSDKRKHSSKKDKRKDKIRDSFDTDEPRDEKTKPRKNKSVTNNEADVGSNVTKKDGKMEDIFGPISDESDSAMRSHKDDKISIPPSAFDSRFEVSSDHSLQRSNTDDFKVSRDKEENRRKKEKKRREKEKKLMHFFKDDDNSLDVDAASRAIEAQLFADTEDDSRTKLPDINDSEAKLVQPGFKYSDDSCYYSRNQIEKHNSDKLKREGKEKKKKKKRNKEERQNRKDHHLHIRSEDDFESKKNDITAIDNAHKDMTEKENIGFNPKSQSTSISEKQNMHPEESASLPMLLDGSVISQQENDSKNNSDVSDKLTIDETMEIGDEKNESKESVVLEPISLIEEDTKPPEPTAILSQSKDNITIETDIDEESMSEVAVRSISNIDKENQNTGSRPMSPKVEEKVDEKPRAVISQEETEDAVAALLGESFGGNQSSFDNCFGDDSSSQGQANSSLESENILEEDAEEMRRAVQNLNASELEIKPETPLSDNDLLLIDTDNEDPDDAPESAEKSSHIVANPSVATKIENTKTDETVSVSVPKSDINALPDLSTPEKNSKHLENDKMSPVKPHIISTATPVITSWTLTNQKLREPQLVNIKNPMSNRESSESKPHITANIIQLKPSSGQSMPPTSSGLRPMISAPKVGGQYQVMNQMIRAQVPNMQPPTIKIPEPHILYHKPQGIVISPRLSGDPRLQSPKGTSPEGMTSPRLAILSPSPQNMGQLGMTSPTGLQQRSPGQGPLLIRMQQPPLSPIQAMHLPHGSRGMVSPNRPNSVLVQTAQGTPIHFNRLPATPVLTPIPKQFNPNNIVQHGKIAVNPNMAPQQKSPPDVKKADQRQIEQPEMSKIIMSTSSLQHSTNPTVMAQNRLISMQNSIHMGPGMPMSNKVLISPVDRRDGFNATYKPDAKKSEQHNHVPFGTSPIIHVSGVNHSSGHILQSVPKTLPTVSDTTSVREHGSNVIHSNYSPRPITNMIQIDTNKGHPSVLSMSSVRPPTVLTKITPSTSVVCTTSTLTNVVMTPLLLKPASSPASTVKMSKPETESIDNPLPLVVSNTHREPRQDIQDSYKPTLMNANERKDLNTPIPSESIAKCETDFEELLKDNTNEIKVSNDPEKKLEINVGKAMTLVRSTTTAQDALSTSTTESVSTSTANNSTEEHKERTESVLSIPKKKDDADIEKNDSSVLTSLSTKTKTDIPTSAEKLSNVLVRKYSTENVASLSQISSPINDLDSKHIDENDSWSGKDVNIESVIKKVDSLCNDNMDDSRDDSSKENTDSSKDVVNTTTTDSTKSTESPYNTAEDNMDQTLSDEFTDKGSTGKRGGRNARGKKPGKNPDRVQTRQISKPSRGGAGKRGRGRANTDKKTKNAVNTSPSNLPGDVYDFHEDSGDETGASPNKEARPRLILTIKSPLSGQTNAVATSSLSITTKEQLVKSPEKASAPVPVAVAAIKDTIDKTPEDFASPSANTRKSRRLQEKEKTTGDDMTEESVKGAIQTRGAKDVPKKRQTRGAKVNYQEKVVAQDSRKSPRGLKRTRDRSTSDASLDSADEKTAKKEIEAPKEPKVARVDPPVAVSKPAEVEPKPVTVAPVVSVPAIPTVPTHALPKPMPTPVLPSVVTAPPVNPTPITKPPKKMISERIASVMEAVARAELPERGMDALEAETRVQSPALPTRPPPAALAACRLPDRPQPLLIRGGETNAAYRPTTSGAAAAAAAAAAPGGPSLPRGAHLPAPAPLLSPHRAPRLAPHAPALPAHPASTARMTVTSVPNISPQGQIGMQGDGMYGHFSHQHYQMYQQHFRATQHEPRASPSPYTRMEAEGSEAPTPPLELRRPPSARVPRPAHSPAPAPNDRLIMYGVVGGRSPPPAHAGRGGPGGSGGAGPAGGPPGPPHASQVPREADSLQTLLRRYPVMWQGLLALKNDCAAVQMHFVGGNPGVAGGTLPRHTDGSTPPLRIAQRMRLEHAQLEQVHRKMQLENEHCILLALPCGRDHMDVLQQSTNLTAGFITYLQRKQAAGIVNVAPPGHHQAMYTVHIFPSCEFANENLTRIAPDLMHRVQDIAHLLIVIATV